MCTLTVIPHDQGFRLLCNRDERQARPAATPPARHARGARMATYPTDPQSGGTWIGGNDAGVVLAILNRSHRSGGSGVAAPQSRGLIIPSLLVYDSLRDVAMAAALLDVSFFEPFQLLALHRREAVVLTSDGRQFITHLFTLSAPLLLTSSSLGDSLVAEPRRRLFDDMVVRSPEGWLAGQVRFHDHQWPDAPEVSVRMQRPGARTVSRTGIDVRGEQISFRYEPLAPDLAGFAAPEVRRNADNGLDPQISRIPQISETSFISDPCSPHVFQACSTYEEGRP